MPLSVAAIATTPGTSLASAARRRTVSICAAGLPVRSCPNARLTTTPTDAAAVNAADALRMSRRLYCCLMITVFSSRQISTPMAGGEASSVNCEVMSVKVTSRKRPSLLEETYFEPPSRYNADRAFVFAAQRRFEVVALQCRHVVGFGRGEKHPVDAGT